MLAVEMGNSAAAAVLLEHGANAALADKAGRSALNRAREAQNTELVRLLEKSTKATAKS